MRKYNRRLLTALVVAYKRGIINQKPLNRWFKKEEIFYNGIKYVGYLILFSFLFLILSRNMFPYFELNKTFIINGYFIEKSRFVSGFMIFFIAINFYKFMNYFYQVYIVNHAMRTYLIEDGDIEKINSITFKINV